MAPKATGGRLTVGLRSQVEQTNRKFNKSCNQIIMINSQIESLQIRYDRTVKRSKRAFRYSLRLRLATLEGVRNMYYEYATRKADELEMLQRKLLREQNQPTGSDEELEGREQVDMMDEDDDDDDDTVLQSDPISDDELLTDDTSQSDEDSSTDSENSSDSDSKFSLSSQNMEHQTS